MFWGFAGIDIKSVKKIKKIISGKLNHKTSDFIRSTAVIVCPVAVYTALSFITSVKTSVNMSKFGLIKKLQSFFKLTEMFIINEVISVA